MSALGWVATMADGSELPFRVVFNGNGSSFDRGVAESITRITRVKAPWMPPEGRPPHKPNPVEPLFQVRGSVRRPTLQGGHITKLVLREAKAQTR